MTWRAKLHCDGTGTVAIFYITYPIHNHFITTLRVAAELDIPVVNNLPNRDVILHDVLLQLTKRTLTKSTLLNFWVLVKIDRDNRDHLQQ